MAIITFLSDFGTVDHYVAAVKAAIASEDPSLPVIDITHNIRPFDIGHAAHVLRHVYKDFPAKTVHLVAVDAMKGPSKTIALTMGGHYFIGFDSGLFSLISEQPPEKVVAVKNGGTTFPAKDILTKAAVHLAQGKPIADLGDEVTETVQLFSQRLKVTKKEIAGHIVHVDHYGNLITNIIKSEFDTILNLNGANTRFLIRFGREQFNQLHSYFSEVESGDVFVFFNSSGQLQIGINKGNASRLLGLSVNSPVIIEFLNG